MNSKIDNTFVKPENVSLEELIQYDSKTLDFEVADKTVTPSGSKIKSKTSPSNRSVGAKRAKGFAPTNLTVKKITSNGLVDSSDQQTPTDPFVALFFYILEQLFETTFGNTHFYSLNYIITDFFQSEVNQDLLQGVAYSPDMFSYYTRHHASITRRVRDKIKNNSSLKCFKDRDPISYQDADKLIRGRLKNSMDLYWKVLQHASIQKRIDGFHTLEAHHVWFYDFTQVEWFGDGTKDSGPYLLFFIDCASRKVVHWALFSKDESISSTLIVNELDKAISNNANKPVILHSDSDPKNLSHSTVVALMDREIIPSVNKNCYGVTDNPHENQVIESFNRRFKEQLKKYLDKNKIPIGSLLNKPFSDLEPHVNEVLNQYHNKGHKHLSMISFDKANSFNISPNTAAEANDIFILLKSTWDNSLSSIDPSDLPLNIDTIKNLDFSDQNDQIKFVEFAQDYIFNKMAGDAQDLSRPEDNSVITLNKMKDETYSNLFFSTVSYCYDVLYAFAMTFSNTNQKLIAKFMKSEFPLTTKGPGRSNNKKELFKQMLSTKQQFVEQSDYYSKGYFTIIGNLIKQVFLREQEFLLQRHAEDIKLDNRVALAQQTDELKQHNQEMQEKTASQIKALDEQILNLTSLYEDTKAHLDSYRLAETQRLERSEKRKNAFKKLPTSPVNYNIFIECLNLLISHEKTPIFQKYANARDRICIFLLFFSGIRVAMLTKFTFLQLATIFSFDPDTLSSKPGMTVAEPVSVPVSKKRKAEQQTFAVSKLIQKEYIFSKHNLQKDFALICERAKDYSIQNNLNYLELLEMPFYTTYQKVDKVITREQLNRNMNKIVREGVSVSREGKVSKNNLKTYTSHSFRYYLATTIIANYDVRAAQQFLHHTSLATTALYDRNVLSNDKIKLITNKAVNSDLENPTHKFTDEQINYYGFRVASNKFFSEAELAKIEAQAFQVEPFSQQEVSEAAGKAQRHVNYKKEARTRKKKSSV